MAGFFPVPSVVLESTSPVALGGGHTLTVQDGSIEIRNGAGRAIIGAAAAGASFRDGTQVRSDDLTREVSIAGGQITIRVPGTGNSPELEWQIRFEPDAPVLTSKLVLRNTTERALALDRLAVLASRKPFGEASASEIDTYSPGYMSWSAHAMGRLAGVWVQEDRVLGPMVERAFADGIPFPWLAHLRVHQDRAVQALLGFTESRHHVGIVELSRGSAQLEAWNDGEGVVVTAGESRESEELVLVLGEPLNVALARHGQTTAGNKGFSVPDRRRPLAGWCSWSAYFENVTWNDILANLDEAARLRETLGLDYFQLDDFYTRVGDWLDLHDSVLNASSALPAGDRQVQVDARMRGLTREIESRGLIPGLWLAPLLVNSRSKFFQQLGENSDWFLREPNGQLLNGLDNWGAPNYVLDLTHPDVEAHLRRVLRTIAGQWGFRILKLDFLYAGAMHGVRHNPNVTSVEAYNLFLRIVREEADHVRIIYCGAPFVESAGGDYIRIGPDVADRIGPQWYPPESNRGDRSFPSGVNSVRESATRAAWLQSLYGGIDSDSIILRMNGDSRLTRAERETLVAVVRATNSIVSLGDDLKDWTTEEIGLAAKAVAVCGRAAEPVEFDDEGRPTALQATIGEQMQEITLINWLDEPATLVLHPAGFHGLEGVAFGLTDLMNGEWLGLKYGAVEFPAVPAHGVRALRVHLRPDLRLDPAPEREGAQREPRLDHDFGVGSIR